MAPTTILGPSDLNACPPPLLPATYHATKYLPSHSTAARVMTKPYTSPTSTTSIPTSINLHAYPPTYMPSSYSTSSYHRTNSKYSPRISAIPLPLPLPPLRNPSPSHRITLPPRFLLDYPPDAWTISEPTAAAIVYGLESWFTLHKWMKKLATSYHSSHIFNINLFLLWCDIMRHLPL